jgi:hypothetical protein
VGIDRPDEDDEPAVERDFPLAERGAETAPGAGRELPEADLCDSPADREAEQVRYRALVDSNVEYGRAGGAWAGELPALREARAAHERRYPHPERSGPALALDGCWHWDSDLKLDQTQYAETTQRWVEIKEEAKDDILPAVERVAAAGAGRHLAGLENWLKGDDRLHEKIARYLRVPELTVGQAFAMLPDAIRFTFVYTHDRYSEGVLSDIERLKAEGFEPIKLKKSWTDDQYKGINSQWHRPGTELRFEVQFHTPESYEAKQLTHWAYERLRGSRAGPAERHELEGYQSRISAMIVAPPGIDGIDEIREKAK